MKKRTKTAAIISSTALAMVLVTFGVLQGRKPRFSSLADLSALKKKFTSLEFRDLNVGSGAEASADSTVTFHFSAYLTDGRKFESSHMRGKPLTVNLDRDPALEGFKKGILGMKPGGRRKIQVPANYGFGSKGYKGLIPPEASFVLDVSLLDVKQK